MSGKESPAVVASSLAKSYRRYGRSRAFGSLKSALLGHGLTRALSASEAIPALEDVSFEVARGETFGVVGANGSGKSTLLKLVAGILKPSAGRLTVNGKVSALIELGAGFHPEISGRENVVINGVMLGLTRSEIEKKLPSIVEYAGLAGVIEEPVKTYSSGMYVRLGFAVAIHVEPDILVVDEVLAVGDEAFAHRCLDTIHELSGRGKTILFVTHSLALVEELCDRVLYLSGGRVKGIGESREMLAAYRLDVAAQEGDRLRGAHRVDERRLRESASAPEPPGMAETPDPGAGERPRRWGDRSALITSCSLRDATGAERYVFGSGEAVTIEIDVTPSRTLEDFVFGIGVFTPEDVCVHGSNTDIDGFEPGRFDAPVRVHVRLPRCDLGAGSYLLDVAVHSRRGAPYDYWRGACRFRIDSPRQDTGLYRPERLWEFEGGVDWKKRA